MDIEKRQKKVIESEVLGIGRRVRERDQKSQWQR
jgi:hypothetical protein